MAILEPVKSFIARNRAWLKQNSKKAFWIWVIYQAIKGIITFSLIWLPLLLYWLSQNSNSILD